MIKDEIKDDPIDSVLKSVEEFEGQFKETLKKRDLKSRDSQFGQVIQALASKDALELLLYLKHLAASKNAIIAQQILHHIF